MKKRTFVFNWFEKLKLSMRIPAQPSHKLVPTTCIKTLLCGVMMLLCLKVEPAIAQSQIDHSKVIVTVESDVSTLNAHSRSCLLALIEAAQMFPRGEEVWDDQRATLASEIILQAAGSAEKAGFVGLKNYLTFASYNLKSANIAKLDSAWFQIGRSDVIAVFGPKSGGSVSLDYVQAGRVDDDEQRWLDYYLTHLTDFENFLALPTDQRQPRPIDHKVYLIANLARRGGSMSESSSLSAILPLEANLRKAQGRNWVFWKNMLREFWFNRDIKPVTDQVLVQEQQQLVTPRAHLNFYATRFTTYDLDPQLAQTDTGMVPFAQRFGDLHNPLIIARADILSVLVHEWLISKGVLPADRSPENLVTLGAMSFYTLHDAINHNAPAPHRPASALIINYARERGAVTFDARQQKWRIDPGKFRAAIFQLATEIFRIQLSGDVPQAQALIDKYGQVGPEVLNTVEKLKAIEPPQMIPSYVIHGLGPAASDDPSSQQYITASPNTTRPSGRAGHCLVYDEQLQMILLLNGYQPPYQPEQSEIWGWNGARWNLLAKNGPPARSLSGAAYDVRRRRVVEFGGVGNKGYSELMGDTWEWDGRAWHLMADTSVGTRDHHAMVYDEARGVTVMYGGQNSAREFDTSTWEWNGTAWKEIVASGPGNRVHHAMAYDAKRKRVVLFGGFGGGDYLGDTWEWDGKTWQQVATSGPPPRARHRMTFDAKLGQVLLFGGTGVKTTPGPGFNFLGDTWLWDGHAWSEAKISGPPARSLHAMAYDVHRQKIVLFGGGNGGNGRLNDTWEWDGKEWREIAYD